MSILLQTNILNIYGHNFRVGASFFKPNKYKDVIAGSFANMVSKKMGGSNTCANARIAFKG